MQVGRSTMLELIENNPQVDVQESEYRRLLGYPRDYEPEARSNELAAVAREWFSENGRPWFYLRQVELKVHEKHFSLNGTAFRLSRLQKQLRKTEAHTAFVAVVSAGRECEDEARRRWYEDKPDEYFFLESYGSAVVERLTALAANRMCQWADAQGMVALPHYSPGYSGWDIADQVSLFGTIVNNKLVDLPGPLGVLDSGMLNPRKSLITVFGITRHTDRVEIDDRMIPCENCSLPSCAFRRAPYKHTVGASVKSVGQVHDPVRDESPLTAAAAYSINPRTLRKWSAERLRVNRLDDDSIEAHFHYEGTTCSNMGRPLHFDYRIDLGPAAEGYVVRSVRCEPTEGDDGYKFMCSYLTSPETFPDLISAERPMVGQRLDDVLNWKRESRPAGCYCTRGSRNHKWGIVFEVLHFALANGLE